MCTHGQVYVHIHAYYTHTFYTTYKHIYTHTKQTSKHPFCRVCAYVDVHVVGVNMP